MKMSSHRRESQTHRGKEARFNKTPLSVKLKANTEITILAALVGRWCPEKGMGVEGLHRDGDVLFL